MSQPQGVGYQVLLVYDTSLTLGREVPQVWSGGSLGFSVLYVTTRYTAILNRVVVILERVSWDGQSKQFVPTAYATL
ncbi:hypothetical protein BD413DRAFT_617170 [Trametes elegans]|nr:hypothetical protein BD413DRAFT_618157 [Trametes elegans]KAI0761294.1 hypothetical protein BD413DRAFT_617170 [Trametes elegans]